MSEGAALRALLGCAVVLVVFGLVAALFLDTDDDEAAGDTTTTTEASSEDGDSTTSTSSGSTSTSTSSGSSSTTATTRGTTTTTSTPATRATTTTSGSGATTTTGQTTSTTVPPEQRSADLTLSRTSASPPAFRFSIGNAGPHVARDVVLVISVGPGMAITAADGQEGMACGAIEGATVRCTVAEAPVGGRVGAAQIQVTGDGAIVATVQSTTADPDPSDNTVNSST